MKRVPMVILAAVGAAFLLTAPVFAETREEAVAYVFLGLSAGAEIDRGPMHLSWRATSSSPATFFGHGEGAGRAYDVSFTVKALSSCRYEIQLAGPLDMVPGGTALYARILLDEITGVTPGALQVGIEGDGFCQTGERNPNCTRVHKTDIFGALDPAKHTRLLEHLQSAVCVRVE
jgi:hypothetical protein